MDSKGENCRQTQGVATDAASDQQGMTVQTHLDGYVEHESWFPCVRHAHHSDAVSIANTHLLERHDAETHVGLMSGQFLLLFYCHPDRTDSERCHSGGSWLLPYRTWKGSGPVSWKRTTVQPGRPSLEVQSDSRLRVRDCRDKIHFWLLNFIIL